MTSQYAISRKWVLHVNGSPTRTPIKEMIGNNENQLNDDEAQMLEGEITYEELTTALKNMKHSKSPGNDGFTTEFFKFFAVDLGKYILRSINYAYRNGLLSVTQKARGYYLSPKAE